MYAEIDSSSMWHPSIWYNVRVSIRICYPFLITQSWHRLCKQIPRFLCLCIKLNQQERWSPVLSRCPNYTVSTITSRVATECNFQSRYVIFYNTRAGNLSSKIGYSNKAEINLCEEVEVYGYDFFHWLSSFWYLKNRIYDLCL